MPKSPSKSPDAPEPGALVKPKHGNGMIRRGSKPGTHRGGTGRPPSAVRASMRLALDERIPIAAQIADDPDARPSERLAALELLARYGLGTRQEVTGEDGAPVHHAVVLLPPLDPRP